MYNPLCKLYNGLSAEEVEADIQQLRKWMALCTSIVKGVIDRFGHPKVDEVKPADEWEQRAKDRTENILKKYIHLYGFYSIETQTLCKMIIPFELSSVQAKEKYKEQYPNGPAAFQNLPPAPFKFNERLRVIRYVESSLRGELDDKPNCRKLRKFIQKHYKRYMSRLKPQIYLLTNGSSTRHQDVVDIQDINGVVYVTKEELEKIEGVWAPIIEHFKMNNFIDDFIVIEQPSSSEYGSVNVAPDDSGKLRISFRIDACVQAISKALAKCVDYVARKIRSNCTKDQMRIIRTILKNRDNKTSLVVSMDMSKYSDTLLLKWIWRVLELMGLPSHLEKAFNDLFSLPLWDTVWSRPTGRTKASYQGQYADFSLITLVNIWIQCCVFDYLGVEYEFEEDDKLTGGAVGDDTICVLRGKAADRDPQYVFNCLRSGYAAVGVSINESKTHMLVKGEGVADFIKRYITAEGLVGYLRVEPFLEGHSLGEQVEELLRYGRDNLVDESDQLYRRLCWTLLPAECAKLCCSLHKLNGGVMDRPITTDDLKLFCFRDGLLSAKYSIRHPDQLRRWVEVMHSRGIQLRETCLLGLLDNWDEYVEVQYLDDMDYRERAYLSEEEKEQQEHMIEEKLFHCYTHGFEKAELSNLEGIVGLRYDELKRARPDVWEYLNDYCQGEIYRYLEGRQNRKREIEVYDKILAFEPKDYELPSELLRMPLTTGYERQQVFSIQCNRILKQFYSQYVHCETSWQAEREYLRIQGEEYRLYNYSRSCRRLNLPLHMFRSAMHFRIRPEEMEEAYQIWLQNLPYPDYYSE